MAYRRAMANHTTGGSSMMHELDEQGEPVHVDVDPFIPTGSCAICAGVEQENRSTRRKEQSWEQWLAP